MRRQKPMQVEGVALGTAAGVERYGYGEFHESIPVPPDPQTVALISRVTGGASFVATDAARLVAIYRQLAAGIAH